MFTALAGRSSRPVRRTRPPAVRHFKVRSRESPPRGSAGFPEAEAGKAPADIVRRAPTCSSMGHGEPRGTGRIMKRLVADTLAMVTFSTILGAFVEVVVAGLEPAQSLGIRLAAIPVTLITGRPYGLYRDWLFERFGGQRPARLRSLSLDTLANVTFQVPLYIGLLAWGGASAQQVLVAATTIGILASVSGRPYGVFLNYCRRLFGLPTPHRGCLGR